MGNWQFKECTKLVMGFCLVMIIPIITSSCMSLQNRSAINNQNYKNVQQALESEMSEFAQQVMVYYKTPLSQGGAGNEIGNVSMNNLSVFIGFDKPDKKQPSYIVYDLTHKTKNYTYKIHSIEGYNVKLVGTGNAKISTKHPQVIKTINLLTGVISSTFDQYDINQLAVSDELSDSANHVVQYFFTPVNYGGAGQNIDGMSIHDLAIFIGFDPMYGSLFTDNGEYRIISIEGSVVKLAGLGFAEKGISKVHPKAVAVIDVSTKNITSSTSEDTNF